MSKKYADLSSSLVAVEGPASASPDATTRAPKLPAAKHPGRTGRPVSKPDSKKVIYNLPMQLIMRIDEAAEKFTAGNKSRLVEDAVKRHIEALEQKERGER